MKIIVYFIVLVITAWCAGCTDSHRDKDTLFQVSTINDLLNGAYRGQMTFKELKQHGDVGIGTLDALDGEMIGLDGRFYQIKADGIAYPIPDLTTTPFAIVSPFEVDKKVTLMDSMDLDALQRYLDGLLPDSTIFYAIKIEGTFNYIKTRSVPRQREPYPPLVEAVKKQTVFEFHDVKGTIVGFRCPDTVAGLNVPGYHFHFITQDRKAGGHLLACQTQQVTIALDYTTEFYMALSQKADTPHQSGPNKDRSKELKKIEQQ
jgi:acetolactate decarboxylase